MTQRRLTLAALRVNEGLRQKEVAKKIGVAVATLQNWEKGATMPSIGHAQLLAENYTVKLDDIIFALDIKLN